MSVIAMTREMGSLGRDVALVLADRLGLVAEDIGAIVQSPLIRRAGDG